MPRVLALLILVVLGGLAVRQLWSRRRVRLEKQEIKALLADCHGDQDLTERLIFSEMQEHPQLSYGQAARRARLRLERDRA